MFFEIDTVRSITNFETNYRVGLSWQKSEWKWKEKGKGIALFALNVPLNECDLLDNRIGRLLTNFQISATLSKKVLIFPPNCIHTHFNFKSEVEVDTFFEKIRTFFY